MSGYYPLTFSILYSQEEYEKDKDIKNKEFFKGRQQLLNFARSLNAGELLKEELTGMCYFDYTINDTSRGRMVHWSIHQYWEVIYD